MATVLESLVVPRSSALPRPTLPAITASSSPTSHRPLKLPQAHGLKLSLTSTLPKPVLRTKFGRGARIVCEAQNTTVEVAGITEDSWKSLVLESDLPVLVEFWAPWCGPCRIIHPVIDELAKEYYGKLKCYKVNTDECKNIPTEYGIRSIPTVLIFKGGERKDAVIGAVPKSTLTSSIEKFL